MRPTGRQPELDTESPALCCYASEPHTRPDCGLTPVVAFGSTRLCASCAARRTRPSRRRTDSPNTRQLIHARIDILRAGQRRRGGEAGSVVDHLATILAGERGQPSRGLGRHTAMEPSVVDAHDWYADKLAADMSCSRRRPPSRPRDERYSRSWAPAARRSAAATRTGRPSWTTCSSRPDRPAEP